MTARGLESLDRLTPELGDLCAPCFRRIIHSCKQEFHVPLAGIGLREGRHIRLYSMHQGYQRLLLDDALCALPLAVPCEQIAIRDLELLAEDLQPHLALALGFRSYLGVPLFIAQQLVGSLSLGDYQPRDFSLEEIKKLKEIAHWTSRLLALYV